MEPTLEQREEAARGVASRGWEKSNAQAPSMRPRAMRDSNGEYKACEHCGGKRTRARWPLFFRRGEHAGEMLWTCSTCKKAQADSTDVALLLIGRPPA